MQIEVHDLSFAYPKHPVLQHLNFSIPQGELVALLGPNGAGKARCFAAFSAFCGRRGKSCCAGGPSAP